MLNMMDGFKVFNGTKETYTDSGKVAENIDSIVFITGNGDVTQSCIYARGIYFANFSEFLTFINYFKGVQVNGTNYNAAVGGGYLALNSKDSETLEINVGSNGVELGLTDKFIDKVNSHTNPDVFIGTQSEYKEAYASGNIKAGALVIILEENEITSSSTIALLGTAILGTMVLGTK